MAVPDPLRLGQVGEDGVLRQVLGRYAGPPGWLRVPPGDDAAVIDPAAFGVLGVVAAMDTVVEGRDFVREWSSGADVAAQNFADIAAMGARPVALLVSLTAPGDLPLDFATGLADGLAAECARAGAAVAGGDLSDGDSIVVSATALGALVTNAVRRRGAAAGDVVAVAGVLGASAAGLALLQAGVTGPGRGEGDEAGAALAWALAAHRRPAPPYLAGPIAAAAGATAMIDVSDGLVRDAARVADASAVVLALESRLLVPDPRLAAVAGVLERARPQDARPEDARRERARLVQEWVMTGGEDHALLACFPHGSDVPSPFRRVGTVEGAPRTATAEPQFAVRLDGELWSGSQGWRHWPVPDS